MRIDGRRVRLWLEQTKAGRMSPMDLFPRLARALPWVWVGIPSGPTDLDWQAVFFTGREVARASVRGEEVLLRRADPLRLLIGALRAGREQMVLDPGMPSRLVLPRPLVRLLFREYGMRALERRGGAWVLMRNGRIQGVEVRNRAPYVPLYLTRADAMPQVGEVTAFKRWAEIRRGCWEASTDQVHLHAGRPEQIPLHRRHLSRFEGRAQGGALARLEQALARGGGAGEVSRLLASLDRIWAPTLPGGEVVPVRSDGRVMDLFTSAGHAESFLLLPACPYGDLVQPRLVETRPLFERLTRSRMPVVINAGWAHQWQVRFQTLLSVTEMHEMEHQNLLGSRVGNPALLGTD